MYFVKVIGFQNIKYMLKRSEKVKKSVFMVMPFNNEVAESIYNHSTRPICEEEFDLEVKRADEIFSTNPIFDDIVTAIERSTIIIVDITDRNPNVFYELGMAHTLKQKNTIMITQDNFDEVPFDISHFRIIQYENTVEGKSEYEATLRNTLKTVLSDLKSIFKDEFELVKDIFMNTSKKSNLYYIPAINEVDINLKAKEPITVEGHNDDIGHVGSASSVMVINALKPFLAKGYCKVIGENLLLTDKGKGFADFLKDEGYIPDKINDIILSENYIPIHKRFDQMDNAND